MAKKVSKAQAERAAREIEADARELEEKLNRGGGGAAPVPAAPVPYEEPMADHVFEEVPDAGPTPFHITEPQHYVRKALTYPMGYVKSSTDRGGRVLRILNKGEELEVIGEDQHGWTKVRIVGDEPLEDEPLEGYVKTAFLGEVEK